MSEGTRTPDRRDHNPELYQLSYAHQATRSLAAIPGRERACGFAGGAVICGLLLKPGVPEQAPAGEVVMAH